MRKLVKGETEILTNDLA